jgi:hypothetical protein
MPEDQWTLRIQAARDAQTRSRFAFLASTVISVAMLISIFNYEFSWLRNVATGNDPHIQPGSIQEELRREARKEWIDSGRMKISLLGVDLAESDASLLGSFGLYVLTIWFFYCMRRENHLIAHLIIDADQNEKKEVSLSVYHGIASYTVFTTIGGDYPIGTVRPPPTRWEAVDRIRFTNLGLLFLPAITILLMMATDMLSLYRASPYRATTESLGSALSGWEWAQVAFWEAIALLFLVLTAAKCRDILNFEKATEGVLRQFHNILFPISAKDRAARNTLKGARDDSGE